MIVQKVDTMLKPKNKSPQVTGLKAYKIMQYK